VNKHRGDPVAAQKDAQLPTIRTVRTGNDVDTLTKAFSGLTSPLQLRVEQFEMALQASEYPGQPPYNSWYQNPDRYPSTEYSLSSRWMLESWCTNSTRVPQMCLEHL